MTAPLIVAGEGEGEEPLDGAPAEEMAPPPDPSGFDGGWWLEEPEGEKVRTAVLDAWRRQKNAAAKRDARERRNELLRAGVRGVRIVESTERDEYTVRAPFASEDAPKSPNKAHQLIKRIAATLTVDPPAPEVSPTSDSDEERAAAELAERILKVEGAPAERDDVSIMRQMIDAAGTYGSYFRYVAIDPQDRLVPVEIQAHPQAETAEAALFVLDPQTQEMVPAAPESLVTRYVTIDGRLTDVAAEAQMTWRPRVKECPLRPSQVRFVPPVGVSGIEDAPGVLVGLVRTLGEVIGTYYGGERPSEEVCKQLVGWRPDDIDWRRWVPQAHRDLLDVDGKPTRPNGTLDDGALVVTLCLYLKSGPMAPHGAYVCVGGPPEPIWRERWSVTVGDGPQARTEFLPLPLVQMRWAEDVASGDPFGVAGIDELGPMEEIRAAMLKYVLDYAYRFGQPQVFLPIGSTLQPGDVLRGSFQKPPIYIDPGARPFYEELPTLTPVVQGVYDGMGTEMDTASGLEQSAQGVASPSVKSGRHAQQVIEQALVALAGIQQNANKAMCRLWSLRLVFMRAFYDAPRILDYTGDGGDYQQKVWTGLDLMGASDVQTARGSGSMLPRSAKAQLAAEELQMAMQVGDQSGVMRYYRHLTGNTTPLLGLQDDPVRQRILRQLAEWRMAAKAQHPPPPPPQIAGVDETGTPIQQPAPDPVADAAARIFAPNPTDALPAVAPVRFQELADTMAGRAFQQADPRYQQALYAEYERMRAAAGVMTLPEQQQMQQQQAQQQAELQQRMAIEQIETKNANQAARVAYAEKDGGPAAQRLAMQAAVESQMRPGMMPVDPSEGMPSE